MLGVLPVAHAAVAGAAIYGFGYGMAAVWGLRWPAPGRRWQVPQHLLIGAGGGRRLVVWGAILGPGFLTRNPYPGFGMLVLLAASAGRLPAAVGVAAAIGAAHASGRALALLRDSATARQDTTVPDTALLDTALLDTALQEPFTLLLRSLRWRAADGMALLAIAGAAIVTVAYWPG